MKSWRLTDKQFDSCPYGFGDEMESAIVFKPEGKFVVATTRHQNEKGYCTECGNSFFRYEPIRGEGLYAPELWDKFMQVRPCPGSDPHRYCNAYNSAQVPSQFCQASLEATEVAARRHQASAVKRIKATLKAVRAHQKDTGTRVPHGYTFLGAPGTGKSHLCACVVRHYAFTYGLRCMWVSLSWLALEVRGTFQRGMPQFDRAPREIDVMNSVCTAKVLILDDIGAGGNHAAKLVEEIVLRRKDRIDVQTWATSNLSRRELNEALDQRTISRLGAMAPFFMLEGGDQRVNEPEESGSFPEDGVL